LQAEGKRRASFSVAIFYRTFTRCANHRRGSGDQWISHLVMFRAKRLLQRNRLAIT